MALYGSAFMIMWHDIAPEGEAEYHHWHSRQHMPERVAHRGFLRSRRGVNWEHDWQRYFTLYEGEALETFVSEEYGRSLNAPTSWTRSMAPHFRNFLRMACECDQSIGRGVGGALCTLRGDLPAEMDLEQFRAGIRETIAGLGELPTVCGVHLGLSREEFSRGETRETELRPPMAERPFDFVLIVESFGLRELDSVMSVARERLEILGCEALVCQAYDMAYVLDGTRE